MGLATEGERTVVGEVVVGLGSATEMRFALVTTPLRLMMVGCVELVVNSSSFFVKKSFFSSSLETDSESVKDFIVVVVG